MKTFKYILMTFSCACIYSCSDFLDLSPVSNMNENAFYKTQGDFETAIVSAYATLYHQYEPESGASYSEILSDECTVYSGKVLVSNGNSADVFPIANYNIMPSNTVVKNIWNTTYADLNVINKIIDNLKTANFGTQELRNAYEGEMRFLRALYNFNMVRLFGPIPLLDHCVSVEESYKILRSSEDDIYKFIINDLLFASENLPLKSQITRIGQATQGAAMTLLGKVYLTIGDKSAAATILKQVIDSNEYKLLDNYGDLWSMDHKNSEESIFEINYIANATSPASPYMEKYAPFENFYLTAQGYGLNQVTDVLWNNYEEGDPRRDISIMKGYNDANGNWIDIKFQAKWFDDNFLVNHNYYYGNNFIVLRYADLLLMYAEATGNAEYLNMVRRRVGLPEYGSPDYPSDLYSTFELAIEHERNVELALEFHRWFDLKRTGRAISVLSVVKGKQITADMLVLPIPLDVIDQNPEIEQNNYYK